MHEPDDRSIPIWSKFGLEYRLNSSYYLALVKPHPWGYVCTQFDFNANEFVYHPLPLAIIVCLWRKLQGWYYREFVPNALDQAYREGYSDGQSQARHIAKLQREASEKKHQQLLKWTDEAWQQRWNAMLREKWDI